MNKFLAALMTLIILGTVVVVFGLGVMSLSSMPSDESLGAHHDASNDQSRAASPVGSEP